MGVNLSGRSFLRLLDFTTEEIQYLLDLSRNFKDLKRTARLIAISRAKTSSCCSRRPPRARAARSRSAPWIWAWA